MDEEQQDAGYHLLGEYAKYQLDSARRDPRLDRSEGALLADFRDSLDEADRVRSLAILGIRSLTPDDAKNQDAQQRQAQWELTEMAKAEEANGHPHLNALTLVGMFGNVDGLVERLAPSFRNMLIEGVLDRLPTQLTSSGEATASEGGLTDSQSRSAMRQALEREMPSISRMRGAAPGRWEQPLASVGLGQHPERPIPADLAEALSELAAIRNVLVHRGGRVDSKAMGSLSKLAADRVYRLGSFVRIDRADYRRYSAALRAYANEIERRVYERSGIPIPGDSGMRSWKDQHYILA